MEKKISDHGDRTRVPAFTYVSGIRNPYVPSWTIEKYDYLEFSREV